MKRLKSTGITINFNKSFLLLAIILINSCQTGDKKKNLTPIESGTEEIKQTENELSESEMVFFEKNWTLITKKNGEYVVMGPCFIDPIGFSFIGYPPDKFVYRNTWKGGLGDIYEIDITNVTVNDTNFIIELSEGKIEISLMSSNLVLVKNLRKGPFSARDVKMDDFFYGQENNSLLVSDDTLSNFKRIPEPDCVL